MRHYASASFWEAYNHLPQKIQKLADKNFELLKQDPLHPSIHFKKVKNYWSARSLSENRSRSEGKLI